MSDDITAPMHVTYFAPQERWAVVLPKLIFLGKQLLLFPSEHIHMVCCEAKSISLSSSRAVNLWKNLSKGRVIDSFHDDS